MRLQANYHGAWVNVAMPVGITVEAGLPHDDRLKRLSERLCPRASRRRILDEGAVIWLWSAERGWERPLGWSARQ